MTNIHMMAIFRDKTHDPKIHIENRDLNQMHNEYIYSIYAT